MATKDDRRTGERTPSEGTTYENSEGHRITVTRVNGYIVEFSDGSSGETRKMLSTMFKLKKFPCGDYKPVNGGGESGKSQEGETADETAAPRRMRFSVEWQEKRRDAEFPEIPENHRGKISPGETGEETELVVFDGDNSEAWIACKLTDVVRLEDTEAN